MFTTSSEIAELLEEMKTLALLDSMPESCELTCASPPEHGITTESLDSNERSRLGLRY